MATAPLTVKLRCASWRQLRTIYQRDLSRDAFFLKTKKPPPVGTAINIQLSLPSQSVVLLKGTIREHVPEGGLNGRGPGIDIQLGSIPQSAMWMIETALKSEAAAQQPTAPLPRTPQSQPKPPPPPSMDENKNESEAEVQLLEALAQEYESLQKLNPFQILGVGYEVGDETIRSAFGELTKKYHPDRFRRFESDHIRGYASEIFILIRNAYQQLGKQASRTRIREQLRAGKMKRPIRPPTVPPLTDRRKLETAETILPTPTPTPTPPPTPTPTPTPPPTPPPTPTPRPRAKPPVSRSEARVLDDSLLDSESAIQSGSHKRRVSTPERFADCERLIDAEDYVGARDLYRSKLRTDPKDDAARAGIELCEGLKYLKSGDRLEAAQRFEIVLELDPSNERAARELAEMRRHATNQRKGLLTRLLVQQKKP